MPVRVELVAEAVEDLARYATTGNLSLFLKKLMRLEDIGSAAGLPLGKGLAGLRKIVIGDRNWRIVFTTDPEETVATVLVIGDRDDAACYQEAQRRVQRFSRTHPEVVSLAAAMYKLSELHRDEKRQRRRRRQ